MSELGLPTSWRVQPLGAVCQVVSGATPKTAVSENWGGDVPWLTPDDLSKNRSKVVTGGARSLTEVGYGSCSTRLVPPGSVLFTSRAPIGYVAIAGREICTNQGFKSAVPSDDIDSEFLYYQLQFLTPEIRSRASGTTFLEINGKGFAATRVSLPPLAEQQRIVEILEEQFSRIDTALASIRTVREKARAFRQSLLHSAFSGELAGRVEERGAIPPRWRQFNLGDVVEFLSGYAFKSEWYIPDGVRLVRGQNISHGCLDWADARSVSPARASEFKRFNLNVGDLVLAMDRPLISTGLKWAVLREEDVPSLLLQRAVRLTAKETVIAPKFLQFWIQSPFFTTGINPGRSIGVPHISTKELGSLSLCLPPLEEQYHIVSVLEEQLSRSDAALAIADQLEARIASERRSLLHAAFSGTLTEQWRDAHHG